VFGDPGNIITWQTPTVLGTVNNGEISNFAVSAISSRGKQLFYSKDSGSGGKLPQGLKLFHNGLIVGRTSFEYFKFDNNTTTMDGGRTTYDNTYKFTITASDQPSDVATFDRGTTYFDGAKFDLSVNDQITTFDYFASERSSVISKKTFTINVNNINPAPFENLYLRAFLPKAKMDKFHELMNDRSIFPPESIYRAEDPWFGKAESIRVLFASGLTASNVDTYANAVHTSHYNKYVDFKDVKTAVALDENFNPIYEVVYVEVVDNLEVNGKSVSRVVDRRNEVKGIYTNAPYEIVYPNSFANMKENVVYFTKYTNRGAIPDWMLDQQEDGRILGFTRGFVLAYTVPDASKLIAYRLRHSGFSFNDIDFLADRYQLDNYMSQNYSIAETKFIPSLETTFDRLPPVGGFHPFAGTVDLAVIVPFDEINGKTLSHVNSNGVWVHDGMTLIFAKQENYNTGNNPYYSENDGWNMDMALFGAKPFADGFYTGIPPYYDNINDGFNDLTFYDDAKYALSVNVPGYAESLYVQGKYNDRGGIWKVTVTAENMVFLSPVLRYDTDGNRVDTVQANEYVQISDTSPIYSGCKLYYDPIIKLGRTMPEYTVLSDTKRVLEYTTYFDGGNTRFFNNVDEYALPETGDSYLKFPKINIYA
jgi:hypothetical protein